MIEICKTELGEDYPYILFNIGNLASVYREQGRREEAEQLEVQALETRKIKLSEDYPDTLRSIGNLAFTYRKQR